MRQAPDEAAVRAGVDTGGTFTDLVVVEDGRLRIEKVASTPKDPSRAIVAALAPRRDRWREMLLVHGSTVATNALLEQRGARTLLVTNAGFEDVIEIGRQARPELYALSPVKEAPLVPPALRLGVRQRTLHDGRILTPLATREVERVMRIARRARPESIAVCLLHSYRNPSAEMALGRTLRSLGVPISCSCEVAPEFREFERFSTTVVNAYVGPIMARYLAQLAHELRGARVLMMQSNGGLATLAAARRLPVRTVLSGPAGGVAGAAWVARRCRLPKLITLDMGGTSTDVSLIDGEPAVTHLLSIGARPLLLPSVDVHTVGAGGGSIAWRDLGGALRVGPQSAGADPGPACYGKSRMPTVTDAHLLLGRLPPSGLLGGRMALDRERALQAVRTLATELGASVLATARGILDVADAVMARAIKAITLKRGHDPSDFRLLAFGGAGGLHAVRLARLLGIAEVVIPPVPGALSALGMVSADLVQDVSRTVLCPATAGRVALGAELARLEKSARTALRHELPRAHPEAAWSVDCRYRGQSFEINVPFVRDLAARFEAEHAARYGHRLAGQAIEVVNVRVRLRQVREAIPPPRYRALLDAPREPRSAPVLSGLRALPVYRRELLEGEAPVRGPALVSELSGTVIVEAGSTLRVDPWDNLRITPGHG
ncbi:MAG: hydantoinase/oxoprolinase family protein [Planctomycetota bacterium]